MITFFDSDNSARKEETSGDLSNSQSDSVTRDDDRALGRDAGRADRWRENCCLAR